MPLASEMRLPLLPPEQSGLADAFAFVETARGAHPWLARFEGGYMVHGYQAAQDLLVMDDKLAAGFGGIVDFYDARGTLWGRFMEENILSESGATHARLRNSVREAFTPRQANAARPLMRQVISDLLDEWTPAGEFDFAQFAACFPVTVMCALLGVPAERVKRLHAALENQMASITLNRDLKPAFMAGFETLWRFADELVTSREQSGPPGDEGLLDRLIAAKNAGGLDETELRFMLLTLLVGGFDTSKNMLTMTMHEMLGRPEAWARCAVDRDFCAKVVEEMLRYSTIATVWREVVEDFDYDGVRFPKGALIAVALPLTGRDPSVFADPARFDPERSRAHRHLAFGRGAHICIGMFIARSQLEEGLHLIAQRIANPRLAGEVAWRPVLGASGPQRLPIAFDSPQAPTA
jgi:cytochrome P450